MSFLFASDRISDEGTAKLKVEIIDGKDHISEVVSLIEEYTNALGRDLTFQNLAEELTDPAKKYTAPNGELLLALAEGKPVGMVAYRRHSAARCEMKRLYVRPEARKLRIGDALVSEVLAHAKKAGYQEMVLDTLRPLQAAIALYKKYGFAECEAYYHNPLPDVVYMKREL